MSYEWSNNAQGSQVIFSPASTTTYSLTASNALGCSAQTSVSVTVYPLPVVFAGADTSIPIGSSRTFDDAYVLGNAPFQYTWTPATDLDNPSLLQPTATPISTMAYTLVATDARGCVNTDQVILSILTQGNTLRGQIVYDNLPQSPLQGVKVLLTSLGNKDQYTAYSGANGYFFLENLPTGTYALSGFYDQPWPWGSANASDALIVMRHFGGLESLQGLRELAGDVNASHSLNSTDALMIVRRFTGGIPGFVSGDWVLRPDTMSFGLQDIISRVYPLLSMGDVNGSYVPQLKLEPMAGLRNSGSAEVMSNAVVTLPVYVDRSVQLGAFSLEMNVPEAFELLDVGMAEGIGGQVDYTLDEGRIRLGWFHPTGVDLPQGSPLLELTLRILDQEDPLELLPGAVIELADAEGK
ncbi:MAG: hypothetical protein IH599_02565, partial [Bacteroidales bacterium]|nr:hypothetical protein [Bacteroidales bacterium]